MVPCPSSPLTPQLYHLLLLLTALSFLVPTLPVAGEWPASTPPSSSVLTENKIRLGSTPPSCLNRCKACDPCMAVQVPTLPGKDQPQPGVLGRKAVTPMDGGGSYRAYPYYKPLGWKCRCRDHLFNP